MTRKQQITPRMEEKKNIIAKSIRLQSSKGTKDILIDFAVVYTFVPLWITLLASTLKYLREQHIWPRSFLGDAILMSLPFVLVAIPLHYLRLQASEPSHFLHLFRIECTEKFLEESRSRTMSVFDADILILTAMILSYNLWDPFQDLPLSEISFLSLYSQSLVVLAIYDAGFYWVHRLEHSSTWWYKYHKMHHEVRNTVAFDTHHVGGWDAIFVLLPLYLVPMMYQLCGMAMVHEVWLMGCVFLTVQQYILHSDLYLFSTRGSLGLYWGDAAICHSIHHFKNAGNYGTADPLIWDWLCGTRYPISEEKRSAA